MGNRADNFNRANNAGPLGTPSDGGADWVQSSSGAFLINGNQAASSGGGRKTAYLEAGSADVEFEVTINSSNTSNQALLLRYVDDSNYWWLYCINNYFHLCKRIAGSNTDPVASKDDFTIAAGSVIKVRCEGQNITCYHNGASKIAYTSATQLQTATKFGLYNDASGSPIWDDFTLTDLGGSPPTSILPFTTRQMMRLRGYAPC